MAKESSIAPKERVNITYRPATGDAKEEQELPLKLVVLGDFTQRADSTPLEKREVVSVDKDTFGSVMRAQDLTVSYSVPDRLSAEPDAEMAVELKIGGLKDFEPEQVARQIPALRQLLELREALTALKGPLGNDREFVRRLQGILEDPERRDRLMRELGMESEQG